MINWTTSDVGIHPARPKESLEENPDPIGRVNWMEHLPNSSATNKAWREFIGGFIAERHLGYTDTDETAYWMNGFPKGYALYRHHKTMPEGKPDRDDVYLFGSDVGRFRSPGEFLLHALWLMEGGCRHQCKCKNCTVPPERRRRSGAA
ncbi:Transcription-silencing protein, cryptic loci regulator Clr2 [Ceratobasidium sp. AG-Ba]|nr:Transcription-silencing protein, cryptic loci regulator Clr2 [Ceratobasidium sp. AG-Ba]